MLRVLERKHRDKPLFILGCGPSILNYDLERIKPFVTIGVNRAVKLIDPTYHIFIDRGMIPEVDVTKSAQIICAAQSLKKNPCPNAKHVAKKALTFYQSRSPAAKIHRKYEGLIYGNTSTHAGLHLAYIMHANPIIFLGVDLKHESDGRYYFYSDPVQQYGILSARNQRRLLKAPKEKPKVEVRHKGKKVVIRKENQRMIINLNRSCSIIKKASVQIYQCYKDSLLDEAVYKPFEEVMNEIEGGSNEAVH